MLLVNQDSKDNEEKEKPLLQENIDADLQLQTTRSIFRVPSPSMFAYLSLRSILQQRGHLH